MRIAAACGAVALGACGLYFGPSHSHSSPDAGDHSSSDAASSDATTCTANNDPAPIVATGDPGSIAVHLASGSSIVIRDPDGTRSVVPDAHGDATITIRPPAIVTGVMGTSLESITGVEPGDALCLGCAGAPGAPIQIEITAPPRSDAAGYGFADGEEIDYDAPGPSATLHASLGGPHDVTAVATDASGAVIGWSAAPAQTLTDGATIALGAWQAPATFTATYDHVPSNAQLVIDRAERSSAGALPAWAFAKTTGVAVVAQPASTWGAPLMVVDTELFVADGAVIESQALMETVPASLTHHVDLAQALLPWLDGASYDACTHVVSWTERGAGQSDGVWARVDSATGQSWSVLVPPGTTRIDLDDLTAQLAPPAAVVQLGLDAYDLDAITSYAAMRAWDPATLGPGQVPHRQSIAQVSYP